MRRWLAPGPDKALLLVVIVFFLAELGGPANILFPPGSEYSDLMLTHWPNAHFLRESVWQDHVWPLWNPEQLSGLPFAANPLSGLWYPPNWILLVVPLTLGFNLLLLAHLLLGGLGMLRLMRRLGVGYTGALVAAIGWSLAPKVWAHLGAGHVGLVFAAGWLPWVADAAVQLSCGRRIRAGVLQLALAWGAQFLADPRLAAYTGLALVGAVLWQIVFRKPAGAAVPLAVSAPLDGCGAAWRAADRSGMGAAGQLPAADEPAGIDL